MPISASRARLLFFRDLNRDNVARCCAAVRGLFCRSRAAMWAFGLRNLELLPLNVSGCSLSGGTSSPTM